MTVKHDASAGEYMKQAYPRRLVVILGDQLDIASPLLEEIDRSRDTIWMAEVIEECTHVFSHKARLVVFLSAMRHFRETLAARGMRVEYAALDAQEGATSFAEALADAVRTWQPETVVVIEPGEYRVLRALKQTCRSVGVTLDVRPDTHFLASTGDFDDFAEGRKQLRMEHFYRKMRRRYNVLMNGDQPEGGAWNLDADNRAAFGKEGPGRLARPPAFKPDTITAGVIQLVETRFADHPGSLDSFDWPVTRDQALESLGDFIANRLPVFGRHQDAMWSGEPFLNHSLLSSALNLKLLNPREVISAAETAYRAREDVPLASAEGFIRQILGWREYVRGIYWRYMPAYEEHNSFEATESLPEFFWTGQTPMVCLAEAIGQTLEYGYAHHIQRLMVTGLYCLLLGVKPQEVHRWYLAIYVDAVEWVELPNVLGMSQYADEGLMASKPYIATGKYIQRMSNYCAGCRFDPGERTGEQACPYTTLYWDFLRRHRRILARNPRMTLQLRNRDKLSAEEDAEIAARARAIRSNPSMV